MAAEVSRVLDRMNQLEQQILVHSILYYRLGTSIWSDYRYDQAAKALKQLIQDNPEEFKQSILFNEFKDFDWVSGYDLPLYHPHYTNVAQWLIGHHTRLEEKRIAEYGARNRNSQREQEIPCA